jgi:N-6 DNA Methylase
LENDVRWRYGTPPVGNANYAWIQHFIHHLAPPNSHGGGVAGFVMANGSLSSGSGGEGEIRQRIVEADLVDAIVALPAQLFLTTGIPACLWFLTRDKVGKNLPKGGRGRRGKTLFIDARKLGTMQTRTLRVLTGSDDGETLLADGLGDPKPAADIGRIVYAFRKWRGEPAPQPRTVLRLVHWAAPVTAEAARRTAAVARHQGRGRNRPPCEPSPNRHGKSRKARSADEERHVRLAPLPLPRSGRNPLQQRDATTSVARAAVRARHAGYARNSAHRGCGSLERDHEGDGGTVACGGHSLPGSTLQRRGAAWADARLGVSAGASVD